MGNIRNLGSDNRSLLIGVCTILPLLMRNVAAITAATATTSTTYRSNRNYEDATAAEAAAAAVTAAMTAAALPAAATAKDYSQQLPRYYQAPSAPLTTTTRDVDAADVAVAPLYRNYFENTDAGSDKIGARTVITRDQMAQWRMPAAGSEQAAIATDGAAVMTAAGFVPTTMTAAGQHYATSMSVGFDFPASVGGGEMVKAERGPDAASNDYAYAGSAGKIDYEINEDNYESRKNGDSYGFGQAAVTGSSGSGLHTADAYEMYKYDMNEYAEHMQRALAASAGTGEGRHETTAGADSSNQGGASAYFENRLPAYENYFMPTYQIEQFSNYHNQEQPQDGGQQEQQVAVQHTADEEGREQPQLGSLGSFDNSDVDKNAVLRQFNKGANIENYANDKQKLLYYAKQSQLQQEQQPLQQHRMEHQHQQQQQLQLSPQLRKFPELMHFSLHQHLPHPEQRPVKVPAKATRSNHKVPLSARRRQQQQLQHQRRVAASLPALRIMGNMARLSLSPTTENSHVDSDISSSNNSGNLNIDSIRSRSGSDKRSISEKVADSTSAPSHLHYALTHAHAHAHGHSQPAHVSRLTLDDSVNEIDDTHNNIDDSVSDRNSGSDSDVTNRRGNHLDQDFVSVSHHQPAAPYHHQHYTLPPITTTVRHTPASSAALAGIPLARHVEVTKHIAAVTDYERIHVPYNQSVPIRIPQPVVTTIPRPYAIRVPVARNVVVPKVQEVRIPIEKVKPFPVERPVPFVVERSVPYMVEKQVAKPVYYPYPVQVPIVKTIVHKVPRRHHSYGAYQPHASSSHPFSLGQYHLQHQHLSTHNALPNLHYTHAAHLG
ncbi:uncharacterized protein LOC118738107 [Rhagoletis pomonella]|uniref:uncharacterized protein LOC118738107 n=1 Tax=Rhagoletis pomonella TaxID=28610 RepID=UPI001784C900|nr:uncharacterized protein LOC118738107 [Rhagoletis pomonella]